MKKAIIFGLVFLLSISLSHFCLAAKDGQKGASEQAYEHASDNSVFNRVGDWFATRGRSKEEKARVLEERKRKRETKRLEKRIKREAKKAEKRVERETKMVEEKLKRKVKESSGEIEGTKKKFNKRLKKNYSKQKGLKKRGF